MDLNGIKTGSGRTSGTIRLLVPNALFSLTSWVFGVGEGQITGAEVGAVFFGFRGGKNRSASFIRATTTTNEHSQA